MKLNHAVFSGTIFEPTSTGVYIGCWVADSGHPVDVVAFSGRLGGRGSWPHHPALFFNPRPLPHLDDVELEAAYRRQLLPARLLASSGVGTAQPIPQDGWVPLFTAPMGGSGDWIDRKTAFLDTRNATQVAAADVGRAYFVRTALSTSFASPNDRAGNKRWATKPLASGDRDGPACGPLARALYVTVKEYGATPSLMAPAATDSVQEDNPHGTPEAVAERVANISRVVHGLAKDAPWLLSCEHLVGLLPGVLGVDCTTLSWSELMAILAYSPPKSWHKGVKLTSRAERLKFAAFLQLKDAGHHRLDAAAAIGGQQGRLSAGASGVHKSLARWRNEAATRGAWGAVVPLWDERLDSGETGKSAFVLWSWIRQRAPRILTLLLRNKISPDRLRLGDASDCGPTTSLNTLSDHNCWEVEDFVHPSASWISHRLRFKGFNSSRPQPENHES